MIHTENHCFGWHSKQFSSGTQFTYLRAFYFILFISACHLLRN